MTAKEVKFGDSARKRLAAGVNILANAVPENYRYQRTTVPFHYWLLRAKYLQVLS